VEKRHKYFKAKQDYFMQATLDQLKLTTAELEEELYYNK
jgi:hypothetical protein